MSHYYTVENLRKIARYVGLSNYTRLRKKELLQKLHSENAFQKALRQENFKPSILNHILRIEILPKEALSYYALDCFRVWVSGNNTLHQSQLQFIGQQLLFFTQKLQGQVEEEFFSLVKDTFIHVYHNTSYPKRLYLCFLEDLYKSFTSPHLNYLQVLIHKLDSNLILQERLSIRLRLADWIDFTQQWSSSRPELFYDYIEGKL